MLVLKIASHHDQHGFNQTYQTESTKNIIKAGWLEMTRKSLVQLGEHCAHTHVLYVLISFWMLIVAKEPKKILHTRTLSNLQTIIHFSM